MDSQIAVNWITARAELRSASLLNMMSNTRLTQARLLAAVEAMDAVNAAWEVVVAQRVGC